MIRSIDALLIVVNTTYARKSISARMSRFLTMYSICGAAYLCVVQHEKVNSRTSPLYWAPESVWSDCGSPAFGIAQTIIFPVVSHA